MTCRIKPCKRACRFLCCMYICQVSKCKLASSGTCVRVGVSSNHDGWVVSWSPPISSVPRGWPTTSNGSFSTFTSASTRTSFSSLRMMNDVALPSVPTRWSPLSSLQTSNLLPPILECYTLPNPGTSQGYINLPWADIQFKLCSWIQYLWSDDLLLIWWTLFSCFPTKSLSPWNL